MFMAVTTMLRTSFEQDIAARTRVLRIQDHEATPWPARLGAAATILAKCPRSRAASPSPASGRRSTLSHSLYQPSPFTTLAGLQRGGGALKGGCRSIRSFSAVAGSPFQSKARGLNIFSQATTQFPLANSASLKGCAKERLDQRTSVQRQTQEHSQQSRSQ